MLPQPASSFTGDGPLDLGDLTGDTLRVVAEMPGRPRDGVRCRDCAPCRCEDRRQGSAFCNACYSCNCVAGGRFLAYKALAWALFRQPVLRSADRQGSAYNLVLDDVRVEVLAVAGATAFPTGPVSLQLEGGKAFIGEPADPNSAVVVRAVKDTRSGVLVVADNIRLTKVRLLLPAKKVPQELVGQRIAGLLEGDGLFRLAPIPSGITAGVAP